MEKAGKTDKVINLIKGMKKDRFTGCVKIYFSQGGVTHLEKTEELLKKEV